MIETIIMTAALVILGYGFYMSSKIFWVNRSQNDIARIGYFLVSAFTIMTYFLFSVVLFAFIASSILDPEYFSILNMILATFLLAGAGLEAAVIRYHLNAMSEVAEANVKESFHRKESDKEKEELRQEILGLQKELESEKKISKSAVDRELKLIELSNKIKEFEEHNIINGPAGNLK